MSPESTPQERARHLADLNARGIICAGEVWGQLIEFITPENAEACLSVLPNHLQNYVCDASLESTLESCETEQSKRGLSTLQNWYRAHDVD